MKKTLWGYDVKAVDAEIEKLEMQNYKLSQKIKHLETERGELDARMKEMSEALHNAQRGVGTFADSAAASRAEDAAKAAVEAAEARVSAAIAEAEQAKAAAAELQKELDALRAKNTSSVNDMTREKMENLLAAYADGWKRSNETMKSMLEQISAARERARDVFIQSADEILQSFDGIGAAVHEVSVSVADYENRQPEVMKEFDEIFAMLDEKKAAVAEAAAANSSAEEELEEELPAILKEIKARLASLRKAEAQQAAITEKIPSVPEIVETPEKLTVKPTEKAVSVEKKTISVKKRPVQEQKIAFDAINVVPVDAKDLLN